MMWDEIFDKNGMMQFDIYDKEKNKYYDLMFDSYGCLKEGAIYNDFLEYFRNHSYDWPSDATKLFYKFSTEDYLQKTSKEFKMYEN